jgi:tetratricopeptide (TPR) repeat protein
VTQDIVNSLKSLIEADDALAAHDNERALQEYMKAVKCAETASAHDPLFDRDFALAYCQAGIACAYGRLEMFDESLASADKAMTVLGARLDDGTLMDARRFTIALVNSIRALCELGRREDAKRTLSMGRNTLARCAAWSSEEREKFEKVAAEMGF